MAPERSCTYHSQRNILVVEIWCVTFPGSLESGNTSPLRNVLELKGPIQRASRPHKEKARAWLNLILINIPCKLATGTACFVHLFYHERRWSSSQHEHKSQAIFCTPARCWHLPSVLCNRVFSFRANGSECYFWNYSITSDYNVKLSLEPAAGLGLWVEFFVIWNMIWLNFVENGPCILGGDLKKGRIQLKSWRRKETQPSVPPLSRSESLPAMSKASREGRT